MEENLENKKYTKNLEKLEYKKISNWKKRVKWILIILWLIVVFLLLAGLTLQIFFKIKPAWWVDIIRLLPALILIPLYLESLAIYIIIWWKSKKYLRTVLIISILFFCIIRVVLTKGFVLPDYFEINCIWNEKIIKDECVDCKCEIIRIGPMMPHVPIGHNWKVCCEWTYKYHVNRHLN
jgi:hypothetical protein